MGARAQLRRVRRHWRLLVGLGGLGLATWVLASQRVQLSGSLAIVEHASPELGLLALACEAASNVAWSAMSYVLLPRTTMLRFGRFLAITLAALAITNSVPLGAGASALYVISQLHDVDVDVVTATAVVAGSNLIAIATLIALFSAVLILRTPADSVLTGADDAVVVGVGVAATLGLWYLEPLSRRAAAGAVRLARVLRSRRLQLAAARVRPLGLPKARLLASAVGGMGNWLFDFGALLVALDAVHGHVAVAAAASAYVVGALATNLPVTPGGLGVVEGSITVALVAFGGKPATMFAAVVLYRLASYWFWLPVGWAAYFWNARRYGNASFS